MSEVKSSHDEEFREYVAARSAGLHRAAYLLTGNWATAEDLVQTTLTKTYLAWGRIRTTDSVDAYARRILYNTNASWWRKRSNREKPTEIFEDRPDPSRDFAEQSAMRDAMWKHIAALPKRQRAVLVLRYYENRTDAQIAEVLGISVGTVKSQSSRALAGMRKRLGDRAGALGLTVHPGEAA
ncbi:SigE family RNA polymerase sigma factor [Glycomyces buryatensis]|uniref:SigE family RNA polymerase sigma factor n=1 Tax=Glycomyces buryatensis TaxID=2570927 RepID=A0A4S8QEX9_9ACTN|nr:SigE family RNA polymerase sigma factor [Glycomyces buryatensis]THV43207.1 SigE family RNA polymerase sigma factor [Glycomyces buryatensis]